MPPKLTDTMRAALAYALRHEAEHGDGAPLYPGVCLGRPDRSAEQDKLPVGTLVALERRGLVQCVREGYVWRTRAGHRDRRIVVAFGRLSVRGRALANELTS